MLLCLIPSSDSDLRCCTAKVAKNISAVRVRGTSKEKWWGAVVQFLTEMDEYTVDFREKYGVFLEVENPDDFIFGESPFLLSFV